MEPNPIIPEAFFCKLTHQLMKDPVLDRDGHSYERSSISEFIEKNGISPITSQPLSLNDLIPNIALRKTIEEYFKNQQPNIVNELNDQDKQKFDVLGKEELQVTASLCNQHVMLSVVPPKNKAGIERTPSTVVCVIDVSGSMSNEAKIQTDASTNETYGFNTLDLVKHALRTIIQSMNKDDRLSLVSFSNDAKVVLNLTAMDEAGRKKAYVAVERLTPNGSTNLWAGLHRGMEVLRVQKGNLHKNAAVLVLTDGCPTDVPRGGHIPELQKYKQECGGEFPAIINTFGFGYELDSKLLDDIAVVGKGTYAFIPDGSFVGTIFVNSMGNLLSNVAVNVTLEVDLSNLNVTSMDLLKYFDKKTTEQKLEFKLGSVQFGQRKSLILPVTFLDSDNKKLMGSLKYYSPFHETVNSNFEVKIIDKNDPQAEVCYFRVLSGNTMLDVVENMQVPAAKLKNQLDLIEKVLDEISKSNTKDDVFLKDLVVDLKEQVSMALSKQNFYTKWGRHYLPSLAHAHLLQQCNNFKDPGVQHHGGEIFRANRDKLDQIFLTLPAPEPSIKREKNVPVSNMSNFHNRYGGCFHGDCFVLMQDGKTKKVRDLRMGDIVKSLDNRGAAIKCVVVTPIKDTTGLVTLQGGAKLTPYHPVRMNGDFQFPINLGSVEEVYCDAVFNFVLEEHHIMRVNGVECVTLGHGFKDNSVVSHEYFGTGEVLKDLQKVNGWEEGMVSLNYEWIRRDELSGRICKIALP